jgi:predicted transcriptional regulator
VKVTLVDIGVVKVDIIKAEEGNQKVNIVEVKLLELTEGEV